MLYSSFSTAVEIAPPPIEWEKVSSEPIADPILLDPLKKWINRPLQDDFWDSEAQSLIIVACRAIERYCSLTIAPSTWAGTMPYITPQLHLLRRPFLSVESVEIVEPVGGNIITVDPATYQAARVAQRCGQVWVDDNGWPDIASRQDAVRVTVKTGWPTRTVDGQTSPVIPEDLLHGVLMMVASLDMHRGEEGTGGGQLANTVYGQTHSTGPMVIPPGVQALLAPFRYFGLYTA